MVFAAIKISAAGNARSEANRKGSACGKERGLQNLRNRCQSHKWCQRSVNREMDRVLKTCGLI